MIPTQWDATQRGQNQGDGALLFKEVPLDDLSGGRGVERVDTARILGVVFS